MAREITALHDYEGKFVLHWQRRDHDDEDVPVADRTIMVSGGAHPLWLNFDITPDQARVFAQQLLAIACSCDGINLAAEPFGALQGPIEVEWSRFDGDLFTVEGSNGHNDVRRRRFCPEEWTHARTRYPVPWHPSHWRVSRYRTDQDGRSWSQSGGTEVHVVDDFGNLVEVAEC